jgi:murein DD-endopeptidase MepM/ murein hydrolase activator NlpD
MRTVVGRGLTTTLVVALMLASAPALAAGAEVTPPAPPAPPAPPLTATPAAAPSGPITPKPAVSPPAPPVRPRPVRRPASAGRRVLRVGITGDDVRYLEWRLRTLAPGAADGRFDRRLRAAVARFQRGHRLPVDGEVGPRTWRALGVASRISRPAPAPARVGTVAFPVRGHYVRAHNFGEQRPGHIHSGEDILADTGAPVVAAVGGTVVRMAGDGGYHGGEGNHVILRAADGTEYRYYHLSAVAAGLAAGSVVATGAPLGAVGSTGHSTGPHLHFEMRPGGGDAVDPGPLLDAATG